MKFYLSFMAVFAICQMTLARRYNITCYYDTFSIKRGGFANFTETDIKASLEYCTHLVYGYVGLRPNTFEIETLHPKQHLQFTQVKKLKNQYRNIKFLLSLGGDKDLKNSQNYIKLLEASVRNQQNFIKSATTFLRKYNFDGFDLAYQFPHNKSNQQSTIKQIYKKAKKEIKKYSVKYSKVFDDSRKALVHKQQFTALVNKLKNDLRHNKLMLTLTILPHINASTDFNFQSKYKVVTLLRLNKRRKRYYSKACKQHWCLSKKSLAYPLASCVLQQHEIGKNFELYLNIPAIIGDLDFINLGTFDYSTPERTPHEADFLAPLQAPPRHNRRNPLPSSNIESEVHQYLSHHIHAGKFNLGVAAYGRAWKMTKELKSSVMPITSSVDGPAQGGELTHTPGLLSWPELCFRLKKMSKTKDKKYGNYAYRSANVKGDEGIFVTYEDQDSLGAKAEFVERNSLGGIALFDLTLDDFRGKCKEGKFPALKTIKFKLH